MFKFLLKLGAVVVGIYLLMQIPFFAKFRDQMKASILEKVHNVTAEVDRIQGKIESAEKTIDETRQKVGDITDKIKETGKNVEDTFTTINKTADALKNAIKNDPTVPEGTLPAAEATTTTPAADTTTSK